MASKCSYYKEHEDDQVWWLDIPGDIGTLVFPLTSKRSTICSVTIQTN